MNYRKLLSVAVIFILISGSLGYMWTQEQGEPTSKYTSDVTVQSEPHRTLHSIDTSYSINQFPATYRLIRQSQTYSGGYSSLPPLAPTLYATHYAYQSASIVGWNLTNKENTTTWLQTALTNHFNEHNKDHFASTENELYIRDYYLAITTLQNRNMSIQNPQISVQTIRKFRRPDGSYCNTIYRTNNTCKEKDGTLLATYYAVETLAALDKPIPNQTKAWLRTYWRNDSNFHGRKSLPGIDKLLHTFQIANIDPSSLPEFEKRRAWLVSQGQSISHRVKNGSARLIPLQAYMSAIQMLDIEPSFSETELTHYIASQQLPDGGWSIVNENTSDIKGTYLALSLVSDRPQTIDRQAVRELLRIHSLHGGGVAPIYRTNPSLQSSYYAVRVLSLFDHDLDNQSRLTNWFDDIRGTSQSLKQLYYAHVLATTLNTSQPASQSVHHRLRSFFKRHMNRSKLERLYYAVELAKIVSYDYNETRVHHYVLQLQHDNGGFGAQVSRTDSTFYAVRLLRQTGGIPSSVRNRVLQWTEAQRINGSGYAFRSGGRRTQRAYVYSTYTSVAIQWLLDDPIEQPAAIRSFLRRARNVDGGFFPTPPRADGLQTISIEATYRGLKTFQLLKSQETTSQNSSIQQTTGTIARTSTRRQHVRWDLTPRLSD
jgi:hypothetical protein